MLGAEKSQVHGLLAHSRQTDEQVERLAVGNDLRRVRSRLEPVRRLGAEQALYLDWWLRATLNFPSLDDIGFLLQTLLLQDAEVHPGVATRGKPGLPSCSHFRQCWGIHPVQEILGVLCSNLFSWCGLRDSWIWPQKD